MVIGNEDWLSAVHRMEPGADEAVSRESYTNNAVKAVALVSIAISLVRLADVAGKFWSIAAELKARMDEEVGRESEAQGKDG